jgi:hypothetical protein
LGWLLISPNRSVPDFALADGARTPPEELVNCAFAVVFTAGPKGFSQPAWLNLSPVTWDYPGTLGRQLPVGLPFRSFNELKPL